MINWDEPIEVLSNSVWHTAKVDYLGKRVAVISYEEEELVYNRDTTSPWVRNKQKEPEEKWRPFQTDELESLFGQVLRRKAAHDHKTTIGQILGKIVMTSSVNWYDAKQLFELYELRTDGKWGPCGVKEHEKD